MQREERINTCISLLSCNSKESFLKQIVMDDKVDIVPQYEASKVLMLQSVFHQPKHPQKFLFSVVEYQGNSQQPGPCTEPNYPCRPLLPTIGQTVSKTHI